MYHQALQINMSIPQLIAINGAGGKTSLMYALAREALAAGLVWDVIHPSGCPQSKRVCASGRCFRSRRCSLAQRGQIVWMTAQPDTCQ